MNPEDSAGERVNGNRYCHQEKKDCAEEKDAALEPAIPSIFTSFNAGECRGCLYRSLSQAPIQQCLTLLPLDEHKPSTKVQDLSSKTSKKHSRWDGPPICISPDAHYSASSYQHNSHYRLSHGQPKQPHNQAGSRCVIPPVANNLSNITLHSAAHYSS